MTKHFLKICAVIFVATLCSPLNGHAENTLMIKTYLSEPRQAFNRLTIIDTNVTTQDLPETCQEGDFFFDSQVDTESDAPFIKKWYCDETANWQSLDNPWIQEYDETDDAYTTYLKSCYDKDTNGCDFSLVLINPSDYTDTLTEQDDIDNLETNQPSLTKVGTAGLLADDKCYSTFLGDDDLTDSDTTLKYICDLNDDGDITGDPDEYALDPLPDFVQSDSSETNDAIEFPRMFWWPAKAAFRAGGTALNNPAWDDNPNDAASDNIGEDSIAFGYNNLASGEACAIFGGSDNSTTADYSIIGGGFQNTIGEKNTDFSNHSIIMGGRDNTIDSSHHAVIGAGANNNIAYSNYASIGAGMNNLITSSEYGLIVAGLDGTLSDSNYSFIGSGNTNTITYGSYNTILGGENNQTSSDTTSSTYSLIGGGGDTDAGNLLLIKDPGQYNSILSGKKNSICSSSFSSGNASSYLTIAGGEENIIQNTNAYNTLAFATILGGFNNYFGANPQSDLDAFITILGGANNAITKDTEADGWPNYSRYLRNITILGGEKNVIMESESTSGPFNGYITLGGSTNFGVFPGSENEDLESCNSSHSCQDPAPSVEIDASYANHAFIWKHDVTYEDSSGTVTYTDGQDPVRLNSNFPTVLIAYSDFVDYGPDGIVGNGNDTLQKMKVGVNLTDPNHSLEIAISDPTYTIAFTGNAIAEANPTYGTIGDCLLSSNGEGSCPSSDRRLKENIHPIDNALETLLSLRGVEFDWKDPEHKFNGDLRQIGMIAQEVEIIEPTWVSENAKGIKRLNFDMGFYALAVEAIKKLEPQITQTLNEIDAKIADLQKQTDKLVWQ